jgi:hypothetical protein
MVFTLLIQFIKLSIGLKVKKFEAPTKQIDSGGIRTHASGETGA